MKKVVWAEGKYGSQAKRPGAYTNLNEFIAKSDRIRLEQEEAQAYLAKAMPAMLKLMEIRFSNAQPLTVMRPLRYTTSCLKSELEDDLDKSFYNTSKSPGSDKYVDVVRVINPGTQILLKALDPNLREFIFQDGLGKEHCVSYDDRNALLTQTDVFETVKTLLEGTGDGR